MSDESLEDQVFKGIIFIRNSRSRPSLRAILNFIKRENTNISEDEIKTVVRKMLYDGLIYNSDTSGKKKQSFYINELRHPVDTDITSINPLDTAATITPQKSFEIKHSELEKQKVFTNPETRKSHAEINKHRSYKEIDIFIEKRIT